ncbi:citramalate synthase [Pelagibacteraceae bacterium]|nr:citramalate synthase [Pelagibacteraceae bacterium]
MSKEKIYLFDTTLRDGSQTQGVDFSLQDKIKISKALAMLGLDYIEAGWPGANPLDTSFFNGQPDVKDSTFVAFGMTKKSGRSAENDPGLSSLLNANTRSVCVVGKTWDYHVDIALNISNEENLENIKETTKHFVKNEKEFIFDAEHFFDGYKNNKEYALTCIKTAYDHGARWIVMCDTNGGTLPYEVSTIVSEVAKTIPGANLGIHTHNDTENAVANSLAAVISGVRHVQGTLNGLGERCGNANLVSIIPTLLFKKYFKNRFTTSVNEEKISYLTDCSRLLDEILNRKPNNRAAYVGSSAFAHKGGLHVSAVQKDPKTYEHIDPALVGNNRTVVISDQAGRSNIISRLEKLEIKVDSKDPKIQKILDEVKDREFSGYSYDGADASFELLTRRLLGQVPNYIQIKNYEVSVVKNEGTSADLNSKAKATLIVDGKEIVCEGIGNGPVNALDQAIRNNLENIGKYSEYLKDLKLIDYKVRILNTGTNAMTRVLIESSDKSNENWFTIGVSPNIIEASFRALIDSIDYKLYKSQAPENSK